MDYEKAKLRTDLETVVRTAAALLVRVEALEQQAALAVQAAIDAAAAKAAKPSFFAKQEKK